MLKPPEAHTNGGRLLQERTRMRLSRRAMLLASLSAPLAAGTRAAPAATIRLGVLKFGTVSWEIDTLRRHALDVKAGIAVQAVELASNQATQVALQAGSIDMMVTDWLWVTRQRASGADWTYVPFSNAVGAIVAAPNSPVHAVTDLPGKRLGIAGSPLDKSWLILRAYAKQSFGIDLDTSVEKSFGPPPLLGQQVAAGRLDAVLTFWPFAAKAEAAGMRPVLSVEDMLKGLGFDSGTPMVGYVFSEKWANENRPAIDGFVAAVRGARALLASDDAEWAALKPITAAASDAELDRLRDWFRSGIPLRWDAAEREAASRLYDVLAKIGGPDLVGSAASIAPGTFWQASWQAAAR